MIPLAYIASESGWIVAEIEEAEKMVSQELKDALHLAHHNIAAFHHSQKFDGVKVETASQQRKGISTQTPIPGIQALP